MKRFGYIRNVIIAALLSLFCACSAEEWSDEIPNEEKVMGQPMTFDFTMDSDETLTRAPLPTNEGKRVFITPDGGESTWYEYTYDSNLGLWAANKLYTYNSSTSKWVTSTTTGISWTSTTMTIYALVRNDSHPTTAEETAGECPITQPINLLANQSTSTNHAASDLYGTVDIVTYTSGKVTLHLKHLVAKVVVKVTNCSNPSSWTCTATGAGTLPTGKSDRSARCRYYLQGTLQLEGGEFIYTNLGNNVNVSLLRTAASGTTAEFEMYLLSEGLPSEFILSLTDGTTTKTAIVKTDGGVSCLLGYTTTINVSL